MQTRLHTVYMVSDATGETMTNVMRACLAQFPGATVVTRRFSFTRTLGQVERLAAELARQPGLVFFSVVDQSIRRALVDRCRELDVPAVSLLDPVLEAMSKAFNEEHLHEPGLQHSLDERYFERIDAMHFALALDDGQATERLKEADVVLVGVSRTSKTPTCMYLANKGIKAANIPLVPGVPPPDALLELKGKLIVGLTTDPRRLTDIRRTRLKIINESEGSDYADPDLVETELREARKLYNRMGWMVIDVTRRSIEEVSATIMQKLGAMNSEGRS